MFIIYLAALDLCSSVQDLHYIMWDLSLQCIDYLVETHWLQSVQDSVVVVHWFSCSAACGILVPWPGIKPTPPELQGRFLTTGPPGKSPDKLHLIILFLLGPLRHQYLSVVCLCFFIFNFSLQVLLSFICWFFWGLHS